MRFDRLHLHSYGCFKDLSLDFDPDKSIHILYGPNEAGKSTLMRAIDGFLFGIAQQSQDTHSFSSQNMKIEAVCRSSQGLSITAARRKGLKNTLISGDGDRLDEAVLKDLCGGVSQELFSSIFGIDHQLLRAGGEALLRSDGELGSVLFAAGTGLTNLSDIIQGLEQECTSIFKARANSTTPLRQAVSKYRQLEAEIKEISLGAREWHELEKAHGDRQQMMHGLQERIANLRSKESRLERIRRCQPLLAERVYCRQVISDFGNHVAVPPPDPEVRLRLQRIIESNRREIENCSMRIEKIKAKIEGMTVPHELLQESEVIQELHADLGNYRVLRKTRPVLKRDAESLKNRVEAQLKVINPHAASIDQVKEYRVAANIKTRIHQLCEQYPLIIQRQGDANRGIDELEISAKALGDELNSLGQLPAFDLFRVAVQEAKSCLHLENQRIEALGLQNDLNNQLENRMGRLSLWNHDLALLNRQELPLSATVREYENTINDLHAKLRDLRRAEAQIRSRQDDISRKLGDIATDSWIPSEAELLDLKKRRDRSWEDLKTILKSGEVGEGMVNPWMAAIIQMEEVDAGIRAVDQASALMLSNAARAGVKQSLVEQYAELEEDRARLAVSLESADQELNLCNSGWRDLWRKINVEPLAPREMLEWLNEVQQIIAMGEERDRAANKVIQMQKQINDLTGVLMVEARCLLIELPGDIPLGMLVRMAEESLENFEERLHRLRQLERDYNQNRDQFNRKQIERDQVDTQMQQWLQDWNHEDLQQHMPAGYTPSMVKEWLERIEQLTTDYDLLSQKCSEYNEVDQAAADYEKRYNELSSRIGWSGTIDSIEQAVASLHARHVDAAGRQSAFLEMTDQVEREQERRELLQFELNQADTELLQWLSKYGCKSAEELILVEERSKAHFDLMKRVEAIEQQLLSIGDGHTIDILELEAAEYEIDALPRLIEDVKSELQSLDLQLSEANQDFGVIDYKYKNSVEGIAAAAAEKALEAQQVLAVVEDKALQYIRGILALKILKKATDLYRSQNQNTVLRKAGVIFSQITGERYTGLGVDWDKKDQAVLTGIRNDGASISIAAMSDGTQDQLYLALRLAFIEEYVAVNESLPFIVDDILIHFDDDRARHTMAALGNLAKRTQVIFLTHHKALVDLATDVLPPQMVEPIYLPVLHNSVGILQ